jgi:hypothetical protein
MATVKGRSGCLSGLEATLRRAGHPAEGTEECRARLSQLRQDLAAAEARQRELVARESAELEAQLSSTASEDRARRKRLQRSADRAEQDAQRRHRAARGSTGLTWALAKVGAHLQDRITDVQRAVTRQRIDQITRRRAQVAERVQDLRDNVDAHVQRRTNSQRRLVQLVEQGLESPEYRGALAEERVISELARLGDRWFVLNDIRLELEQAVQWGGGWSRRAQVDHLLVGPPGVIVLETTNWSATQARSPERCPYDQVARAAFICRRLLEVQLRRPTVHVEPWLANAGSLPPKPADSGAHIHRPGELVEALEELPLRLPNDDIPRIANGIWTSSFLASW